jgi:hypothetical protein
MVRSIYVNGLECDNVESDEFGLDASERKALSAGLDAQRLKQELVGPISCVWPKAHPRYLVEVRLRDTGDHFECAGFEVTSLSRRVPINAEAIRHLPVGSLIREAIYGLVANQVSRAEQVANANPPEQLVHSHVTADGEVRTEMIPPDQDWIEARDAYWKQAARDIEAKHGKAAGMGNGRRWPPGHYERVAEIARDAKQQGQPISTAVARAFGISPSAATTQISRARKRGFNIDGKD